LPAWVSNAEGDDVRDDPVVPEGVPGPRPAQADLHLVADQQRARGRAPGGDVGEEAVRWNDQAAVGEDRFHEQAGDVPAGEGVVEGGEDLRVAVRFPVGIGIRREEDVAVRGDAAGLDMDPRGLHRDADAAVVAVLEREHLRATRGVHGGPDGDVVGVGPGVAEVDAPITGAGREVQELLGQRDGVLVHGAERPRSGRRARRPEQGLTHRRVTVPETARRPGGRQVEQPATTGLDEPGALARFERQGEEPELLDPGDHPVPLVQALGRFMHQRASVSAKVWSLSTSSSS
jgi:hypothetical protein